MGGTVVKQFVVARGHNIIEVNERLFAAGGHSILKVTNPGVITAAAMLGVANACPCHTRVGNASQLLTHRNSNC